ncbi:ATP-binding protein [Streptomyces sp. NPDC048639]|uniref:ATP-binding protein n=1 Tax=Streptomyces sp. NPDC048639 TaxID=3365581 RepID=UPI0037189AD0
MSFSRQRRFPRRRASVGAARDFTIATFAQWGIVDRQDDIRVCVSELATNAVLHGVPPGREFRVHLTAGDGVVRLEVRDSGDGCPEVGSPLPGDCRGRGLWLVEQLADDWGSVRHRTGKSVWAVFKIAPSPATAEVADAE